MMIIIIIIIIDGSYGALPVSMTRSQSESFTNKRNGADLQKSTVLINFW